LPWPNVIPLLIFPAQPIYIRLFSPEKFSIELSCGLFVAQIKYTPGSFGTAAASAFRFDPACFEGFNCRYKLSKVCVNGISLGSASILTLRL
jgi:hypothetical protein